MKLLIITALFVAAASGSPVSHTLEVGSNGVVGTSAGSVVSPLVSLIINIGKGLGNLVAIEGVPETPAPVHPVIVVDQPALPSPVPAPVVVSPPEVPGVALPELPGGVAVVDPIAPESPIVVPGLPESVQVVTPILPESPVQVVDPVAPESPIVVPGLPETVQVVEPVLPGSPVQVVDIMPEVPEVPGSEVQVVDGVNPAPAPAIVSESEDSSSVTNNFLINVLLNFFTGKDGTPSFSSGIPDISSLPPGLQQLFTPTVNPRAA